MFVDKARIFIKSGKGGDGCLSFRREKFIPRGGPNGGDGGRGGSVYIQSNPSLSTLLDLANKPHYSAQSGFNGSGNNRHGGDACDLLINVPCGTLVYRVKDDTRILIADLKEPFHKVLVAKGGRGGRGNYSFRSQKNRAPQFAEKGEPEEKITIELELKLIADVGLIGCPNAGKSTLLSCITAARPKIADYPFTTLSPNLGVASWKGKNFVAVDVPGLIEDASAGRGLGDEFLRHIERTRILVHLVDIFGFNNQAAYKNYLLINRELGKYSRNLVKKPIIIAVNKMDLTDSEKKFNELKKKMKSKKIFRISAATGKGTDKLLDYIVQLLDKPAENMEKAGIEEERNYVFEPEFVIKKQGEVFVVGGEKAEKLVAMTNFNQEEAVSKLQYDLKKMGIEKMLRKYGVKDGDTVRIGSFEFVYEEAGL